MTWLTLYGETLVSLHPIKDSKRLYGIENVSKRLKIQTRRSNAYDEGMNIESFSLSCFHRVAAKLQ